MIKVFKDSINVFKDSINVFKDSINVFKDSIKTNFSLKYYFIDQTNFCGIYWMGQIQLYEFFTSVRLSLYTRSHFYKEIRILLKLIFTYLLSLYLCYLMVLTSKNLYYLMVLTSPYLYYLMV